MRYALYLLPGPETALWRAGSALLGYDAACGAHLPQPHVAGIKSDALRAATQEPRRYGFHMTLKAPFRMAEGQSEAALLAALARFCSTRKGFDLASLRVEVRHSEGAQGFVCLAPDAPCPPLFLLEQDALSAFEPFRAPLNAQEIARRRPERLTPRQRTLLDAYGYPFVLDEFRPHFSLTSPVQEPEQWRENLSAWLTGECPHTRVTFTGIGLCSQASGEDYFRLMRFERFGGDVKADPP